MEVLHDPPSPLRGGAGVGVVRPDECLKDLAQESLPRGEVKL